MAVDERSRHELYERLVQALGTEAAVTMMEHLPPVGWSDVAHHHLHHGGLAGDDVGLRVRRRPSRLSERGGLRQALASQSPVAIGH